MLAVPCYEPDEDAQEAVLQGYRVWWDGHYDNERPWASENPKRYLSAQIAVGTVDQAMLGALRVKHAHMRAAGLARNLLVVDEVHASDTYMSVVLEALLKAYLGAGGYALLMSATLGSVARRRWLSAGRADAGGVEGALPMDEAIKAHYPAVSTMASGGEKVGAAGENSQEKTVDIKAAPEMQYFEAVARRALTAARAGAKVLVVRNTVAYAIGTQRAVEPAAAGDRSLLFACRGRPTLHHGRFAAADRRLLDTQVELLLGKERGAGGRVVVGTQTLEQSPDIDADLLITDLCPVDVLLQRIGRLHRHAGRDRPKGYDATTCVVLTPDGADLSPLLTRRPDANGLGPYGYVHGDLRVIPHGTTSCDPAYLQWLGGGGALRHIDIVCPDCQGRINLGSAYSRDWRCSGRFPEQGSFRPGCERPSKIIQRGAANLRMAELRTALTIPPRSTALHRILEMTIVQTSLLASQPRSKQELLATLGNLVPLGFLKQTTIDEIQTYSEPEILSAWNDTTSGGTAANDRELRLEEFRALQKAAADGAPPQPSPTPGSPPQFEVIQQHVRSLVLLDYRPVSQLRCPVPTLPVRADLGAAPRTRCQLLPARRRR